ncbi:MAG: right-handed parallel beta-helix repeat-containing protein [Acidobacteria bacterium]|nr:right-handed parallel beta-helix repeat-containing protein [Acidobacteriota bacterium]MBI3658717.1 right-handed parallel beta-helix repeat-containing protein [Acidobacteriota bacterium]
MVKRYFVFPFLSLVTLVLLAALGTTSVYAQFYVLQGDDPGLAAALAGSPPCSIIMITSMGAGAPLPFTSSYTLGPGDSGKKIMAAPGETALFIWSGGAPPFTVAGATNVVLENLVITGNAAGAGVQVDPGSVVKIINCQIACNVHGVYVRSSSMAEIEGSRILNNAGFGVYLESLPPGTVGATATIEKTQVRNNQTGVVLRGTSGKAKIWHSMIDKNTGNGVQVHVGNSAVLNNNDISFNGANGVGFDPGALGSLSFNTIAYNTAAGVVSAAPVKVNPGHNTLEGNSPNFAGQPFLLPNQF